MLENEGVKYGSTIIENKMNAQGGGWFFVVNFSYDFNRLCVYTYT